MTLFDRALIGLDAQLILSVHDELLCEAAAADAREAERRLAEAMTKAFVEFFPGAPCTGLVTTRVVRSWSEVK